MRKPKIDDGDVRSCPRCLTNLRHFAVGETAGHGCRTCGGVWLDRDANLAVVHSPDDASVNTFRNHSAKARRSVDETPDGLSCPICDGTLRRHRIEGAWLDVDICDVHGTWYDRGEVERVIAAMKRPEAEDWRPLPTRSSGAAPTPEKHAEYLEQSREFAAEVRRKYGDYDVEPKAWVRFVEILSED